MPRVLQRQLHFPTKLLLAFLVLIALLLVFSTVAAAQPFGAWAAATTNVFYRLEVLNVRGGANRIYFNYPGPPAPAMTDTAAFATCP